MWVKICGNTNLEDARATVEAGADALGFIFAPSPRRISPREAKKIIAELPEGVEKVGVFVNQKPEIILDTVETAGLTGVQLHGDEGPRLARTIGRTGIKVYKALSAAVLENEADGFADAVDALFVDAGSDKRRGGAGKLFDWDRAAPIVRLLRRKVNIVVAGGLEAGNVGRAIELFHPWGVDVVSGVEREPGKKDHEKVRAFVKAAKAAAQA
ncbi:MAG TPA: phosphoribosylanthranilate isomerase [Terriglobales bacterium]|nr:phosphoribosylanthranilate isomerase [Terriglobales bacterium]